MDLLEQNSSLVESLDHKLLSGKCGEASVFPTEI